MSRKCGFSVTEAGLGGRAVLVPITRLGFGGEVGRRDRVCVVGLEGVGRMYFRFSVLASLLVELRICTGGRTMFGLLGRVEMARRQEKRMGDAVDANVRDLTESASIGSVDEDSNL